MGRGWAWFKTHRAVGVRTLTDPLLLGMGGC